MTAYENQLAALADLHKAGSQYDRLFIIVLVKSLQAKIKKLSRHVEPK
jgi:hypothetical protein